MTILEVLLNIFSIFWTYGCCSDALVEEEVGGNSVADIFEQHGETFFRNKEVSWIGKLYDFSCYILQCSESVFSCVEILDFPVCLISSSIHILIVIYLDIILYCKQQWCWIVLIGVAR